MDAAAEAEKFKDFEFMKARSDWPATWRTWVRNARDGKNSYARRPPTAPDVETADAPAVLPNGEPNPLVVIGGKRVRQFILGPNGQVGTNPAAVRW